MPGLLVLAFPGGQSPEVLEQSARFLTWHLGKPTLESSQGGRQGHMKLRVSSSQKVQIATSMASPRTASSGVYIIVIPQGAGASLLTVDPIPYTEDSGKLTSRDVPLLC